MSTDFYDIIVKSYTYDGEKFEVEWQRDVPYLTVRYKDQVGYVGINPEGTTLYPFYWVANDEEAVTPRGLSRGNVPLFGGSLATYLVALCRDLIFKQAEFERVREYAEIGQGERALHDFIREL